MTLTEIEEIVFRIAYGEINAIYQDNGLSLPSKTRNVRSRNIAKLVKMELGEQLIEKTKKIQKLEQSIKAHKAVTLALVRDWPVTASSLNASVEDLKTVFYEHGYSTHGTNLE